LGANLILDISIFILGGTLLFAILAFALYMVAGKLWLERALERRLLAERLEMDRKLEEIKAALPKPEVREARFPNKEPETLLEIWKRLHEALQAARGYGNYRMTRSMLYFDPHKKNGSEKKLTDQHKAMVDAYTGFREYFICSSNFLSTEVYLQLQGFVFDLGLYITRLADCSDAEFAVTRRELDDREIPREKLICQYLRSRVGYLIE
jgi:hypothetical protein